MPHVMHQPTTEQNWTEIISPRKSLFDLNLREIWRYRDLISLFVRRDFVAIYKQTILGPLWLFLQPLFTTFTYLIVFSKIAKISTGNVPPVLFYLSGITLWTYFSDCFSKTSNTFITNAGVFGKVYFPRLATPVSIVLSNLIKLGIQLLLLAVIYAYMIFRGHATIQFHAAMLLIPYLVLLMAGLGLGLGIIFSSLTTKYRDLTFLVRFGVQLLMYATPVIYPLSFTQGSMRFYISLNPLTPVIESFRYAIFGMGEASVSGLVYASVFALVVLVAGTVVFNQVEKNFMDTV